MAVARGGLAAQVGGRPVLDLARELVEIAGAALENIGKQRGIEPDERLFLDPIREQLETGKSPGEMLVERWRSDFDGDSKRLVAFCSY